jgi:tetratricopeptide (TPR) repeat protein
MPISPTLITAAQRGQIVILAGAGVSAGWPSALPSWKPLNRAITDALRQRLEAGLQRPDWLAQVITSVDEQRSADRFPPEYQAQLIEEMCGERYFHALTALDIDLPNAAHAGIAALAAVGAVRAIVTTNFDRLIERSLEGRGVPYAVAYDDAGYRAFADAWPNKALPVIKIHGCVSAPPSMIDTLKQRQRGRSRDLQTLLDQVQPGYWLYLGFSAADLEGNPGYLGLVAGAARSAGATYLAYPPYPDLGAGAKRLMAAHGERGEVVIADIPAYLGEVGQGLGSPEPAPILAESPAGLAQFKARLADWAGALSLSAAGLCLAAILEAVGQGDSAARLLDRLVRKEIYDERESADFRALQLHYGRLGAAWSRYVAVRDINGAQSNASMESAQSLMRVMRDPQIGFVATAWLACLMLWLNRGQDAMGLVRRVLLKEYREPGEHRPAPRHPEDEVDAWLAAAQVCLVNDGQPILHVMMATSDEALEAARASGDVVRTARVAALRLLALAQTESDVPALAAAFSAEFDEAERVGDGFALGMRALALGRWHVGAGGLALGRSLGADVVARRALEHLAAALTLFQNQGMDAWLMYVQVQAAKAYADLHQWDDTQTCLDTAIDLADRFPAFASHAFEAAWQIRRMLGDPDADKALRVAVQAADDSGLAARRDWLQRILG